MKKIIYGDLIIIDFSRHKKCAIPRYSCLNCKYVERIWLNDGHYYVDCGIHENCIGKRCDDYDGAENCNN